MYNVRDVRAKCSKSIIHEYDKINWEIGMTNKSIMLRHVMFLRVSFFLVVLEDLDIELFNSVLIFHTQYCFIFIVVTSL